MQVVQQEAILMESMRFSFSLGNVFFCAKNLFLFTVCKPRSRLGSFGPALLFHILILIKID